MQTTAGVFKLTIEIGDDAMQSAEDVAKALDEVSKRLKRQGWHALRGPDIYDKTGQEVLARWAIE